MKGFPLVVSREGVIKYIGVTGLPGSGKGEFIALLRKTIDAKGITLHYYSLSDELRAEAKKRNLPVERPILRRIANELRHDFGNGILSKRLSQKIQQDLSQSSEGECVAVIDAIRTPEEVAVLREEFEPNFILVALEAPINILAERVSMRARFDERKEVVEKKNEAQNMILREAGQNEPSFGHNISGCISIADWRIDNSGTLDILSRAVVEFVGQVIYQEQAH